MRDSKPEKPIPATPGFHAKPGHEPKPNSDPNQIAATPGFHAAPKTSTPPAAKPPTSEHPLADSTPAASPATPASAVEKENPNSTANPFSALEENPEPVVESASPAFSSRKARFDTETSRGENNSGFTSVIQQKIEEYTAKGKRTFDRGITQVQEAKDKLGEAKAKAKADVPPSPTSSIGTLVSNLSEQLHKLIVGEIELAKVKATAMAKQAAVGIALLLVAAVFALYMLGFLLGAAASALALVMPVWAAKLVVAGGLLVLVLCLVLIGLGSLKKGLQNTPAPQVGVKKDIAAVKKGLE